MKAVRANILLSLLAAGVLLNVPAFARQPKDVYKPGEGGFNCFRIPAIVRTGAGTLLAFAEGRKSGCGDAGGIDIVVKRSTDDGETWSGLKIVAADGANTCGNPTPVVDRKTGTIFLLNTWNLGADTEQRIVDGTSRNTRRVFVRQSTDDGKTWSAGKDITSDVKKRDWTWYATGPGNGIQIREGRYRGRLVVPCDHITAGTRRYFSHVIFSDDDGQTWHLGGTTPGDKVNESAVAELSGGRLLLNMRNYGPVRARQTSVSTDGGLTWSGLKVDSALVSPICEGSLVSWRGADGRWILGFSNPASSSARVDMTVRISYSEGKSWPRKYTLHKGPSGYSDLVVMAGGNLGCLFEAGSKSAYAGIVFMRLSPGDFR